MYPIDLNMAVELAELRFIVTRLSFLVWSSVLQLIMGLIYRMKILYENFKIKYNFFH